jgi:hypothetical protein
MAKNSRMIRVAPEFDMKIKSFQSKMDKEMGLRLSTPKITGMLARHFHILEDYVKDKKYKEKPIIFRLLK